MDNTIREQGSATHQDPKSFLASLLILAGIIKELAGFVKLTEEEQEDAGIYLGRLSNE